MPTLIQAIAKNPTVNAFRRVSRGSDNVRDWQFEPSPGDVVANADRDGFYVIAAMNIISERNVCRCYMFQLAADEEVSSYFIYGELAQMYGKIGEAEKQKKYAELFRQ